MLWDYLYSWMAISFHGMKILQTVSQTDSCLSFRRRRGDGSGEKHQSNMKRQDLRGHHPASLAAARILSEVLCICSASCIVMDHGVAQTLRFYPFLYVSVQVSVISVARATILFSIPYLYKTAHSGFFSCHMLLGSTETTARNQLLVFTQRLSSKNI